jgi:hypothetical protein
MHADAGKRISERRSSDRVMDDSLLLVSGYNASGLPFSEVTKVNDISLKGISFLLRTPIEIDVILDVSICSAKEKEAQLSPMFQVKAHVLRVSKGKADDEFSLIAADFQGEFIRLGHDPEGDAIGEELQKAIERDERKRDQSGF